ncbi:MAG: HAMP domain-containing histidine kinase [Bacteroidetes bacterium]|nr:HAMP domain-containing histidine kinase [Bacteroidota bacterium]MBS1541087.1 HAMP domain-containing histidine kinase [Bacteroidota bacterium]
MQFFSQYSFIWRFPKEQEKAYDEFVYPSNLLALRLVTFITLFGMTTFLIIDAFRDVNFNIVLQSRVVVLSYASLLMFYTFKAKPSSRFVIWAIVSIAFINFSAAMVTAAFARMPGYYITNLLFLIWILVAAVSGLNLRYVLLLNLALLAVFIFFSQQVHRDPFYFSQYPHLFVSFIYFVFVSVVLEYRRRKSFLQFSELTEQKKLVENLNQQKNKIISILSHDIADPLNSLTSLVHLHGKKQNIENERQNLLTQVGDELKNVTGLLYGLVRWSRAQMDGFVSEKKSVMLPAFLQNIVGHFKATAAEKSLTLDIQINSEIKFYGDEEMIRIAVRNVISNAVKFANVSTVVRVEAFLADPSKVVITIANHGILIPLELQRKLFTYQLPAAEGTNGEQGAGLGLVMASFFIKFNNGDIFLESANEPGLTKFRIELPTAYAEPQAIQIERLISNFSR